ncbi:MAG: multiprotein bridging factor aMBF1 [Methanohalophilus sp.]
MQCEICGAEIKGEPFKINVEGSELNACNRCSQYGTSVSTRKPVSRKNTPVRQGIKKSSKPKKNPVTAPTEELIDEYEQTIREAREAKGFTQEELASEIKEKASLIKKIEKGDIVPEDSVRTKLEHALDIELTEKVGEDDWDTNTLDRGTTLGDIVTIKKK